MVREIATRVTTLSSKAVSTEAPIWPSLRPPTSSMAAIMPNENTRLTMREAPLVPPDLPMPMSARSSPLRMAPKRARN